MNKLYVGLLSLGMLCSPSIYSEELEKLNPFDRLLIEKLCENRTKNGQSLQKTDMKVANLDTQFYTEKNGLSIFDKAKNYLHTLLGKTENIKRATITVTTQTTFHGGEEDSNNTYKRSIMDEVNATENPEANTELTSTENTDPNTKIFRCNKETKENTTIVSCTGIFLVAVLKALDAEVQKK